MTFNFLGLSFTIEKAKPSLKKIYKTLDIFAKEYVLSHVSEISDNSISAKIPMIKELRSISQRMKYRYTDTDGQEYTGMGLKMAKEAIEERYGYSLDKLKEYLP